MYARGLIFLLSLSLLGACSGVPPQATQTDAQQAVLQSELQGLLRDYNARHHSHVQLPNLSIQEDTRHPGMIASADYSNWKISINGLWLKKDPCIVYKEAVAHELAHLLVDYQQFGAPQAATLLTQRGPVVVAFNGPPELEDSSEEHGRAWQAMALELGAHPCEEGYCRSSHPYAKSALTCSAADYALLHAAPPPARPKLKPPVRSVAVTPNYGVSSSRTLFDSQVH